MASTSSCPVSNKKLLLRKVVEAHEGRNTSLDGIGNGSALHVVADFREEAASSRDLQRHLYWGTCQC